METTQQTPTQSLSNIAQSTPASPTPQPAANKTPWLLVTLTVLFAGTSIYFGYHYYQLRQQTKPKDSTTTTIPSLPSSTPKPSVTILDSDNSVVFKNTKHSYQFSYPKNVTVGSKGNADPKLADAIIISDDCNYDNSDRCLTGFIDFNSSLYSAGKQLADYLEYAPNQEPRIISESRILVGGEPALARVIYDDNYYYSSTEHGVVRYIVVMTHNSSVINFDFIERGKDQKSITSMNSWQKQSIVNKIVSSFSFNQ